MWFSYADRLGSGDSNMSCCASDLVCFQVRDCGNRLINGIYSGIGNCSRRSTAKICHYRNKYDYIIVRLKSAMPPHNYLWYIVHLALQSTYYTAMEWSDSIIPPHDGWNCADQGRLPLPSILKDFHSHPPVLQQYNVTIRPALVPDDFAHISDSNPARELSFPTGVRARITARNRAAKRRARSVVCATVECKMKQDYDVVICTYNVMSNAENKSMVEFPPMPEHSICPLRPVVADLSKLLNKKV